MKIASRMAVANDLIRQGKLVVGDGYRAMNTELGVPGIPFARAGNIRDGFSFEGADCFPIADLDRVGIKRSEPGDVVFTSKGSVGRFAFVRESTDPFVYSPQLCFWRSLDHGFLLPEFLFYWMHSRRFITQVEAVMNQTDMAAYVSLRNQRNFTVDIPPLPVQHRIADILSAYDDLIENNNRRMALLEESIHLLYREWFVYLRFPGHERTKIVDGVPEGWERLRLDNLVEQVREGVHPSEVEPETPYVGLEHIPRRCIALSEWGEAADVSSNKFKFAEKDLLFGKIRPYFHKVVFAPVSGICSSDTIVMRPKETGFFGLALAVVSSTRFVDHTWQSARIGAKMPRADWNVMAAYPVLLPPVSLRAEFDSVVSSVVSQISILLALNRKLREARDLLLPRLMDGRIPV